MGTVSLHTPRRSSAASFSGDLRVVLGTLTFPSVYPAGGVALDLASSHPGLADVVRTVFLHPVGGYVFAWNAATKKVQAFLQTAGAGALVEAGAIDLSVLGPVAFFALAV